MKHRHDKISAVAVSDTGTRRGHGDTLGTRTGHGTRVSRSGHDVRHGK
ncbi:hypothetical protein CsSME_00006576 [Camellia sinensis var. sinensis]